ncbi:MAG TPA: TonB-dependent receptor [Thermoanaerobaculia bacterium]|nr:TonB-dependent receptor [Thermoanaerobaculia bacterium]
MTSRLFSRSAWLAIGLLLALGAAHAQQTGRIEGAVQRPDGTGINGVAVVVNETGAATLTDERGVFRFPGLAPGEYTLTFSLSDNVSSGTVEVTAGQTTRADQTVDWQISVFDTITVYSASFRPERIVEAPAAITTISIEEIEREAATGQLPKLLEFTPGVEVTQSGLYDFNFNTRGFNSSLNRRIAVRIDGRDPAVGFLGSQDWATSSSVMDDAASIELLRGPSAALYGANAFNGVLNVITKPGRGSEGGMFKLTGGELSTTKADFRYASDLGGDWYFKILGGYSESDDFTRPRNVTTEYPGLELEAIPLVRDDNEIYYGALRFDKYFDSGRAMTLEGGMADSKGPVVVTGIGRVQVNGNERPWARFNLNSAHWNLLTSYTGRDADDQRSLRSGVPLYLDSERLSAELQGNTTFSNDRGRLVGGLSYKEEDIDSLNPQGQQSLMFAPRDEDFSAAFGQLDYDLTDSLKFVLAARYDDSSLHDSQVSPKASLVWSPSRNHTVRFSYNEAFQVPNYSEFFLQADVAPPITALAPVEAGLCAPFGVSCGLANVRVLAVGNPSLEVEEIETWELGYSGILANEAFLTIDYYRNDINNFITDLISFFDPQLGRINPNFGPYQPPAGLPAPVQSALLALLQGALGPSFLALSNNPDGAPILVPVSYTNFGEVETQGVDVGLNWYLDPKWKVDFTYSWFDFDVRQELAADPVLPNSPENRFALGFEYSADRFFGGLHYRWTEEFPWSAGVFKGAVPEYDLVDVNAGYRFSEAWDLGVNVSNLFDDESYQTFGGDILGRRALGYVRYRW